RRGAGHRRAGAEPVRAAAARAGGYAALMKRAVVALCLAPVLAFSAEPLPARNLLVEWRVSEAVVDQRQSGVIVLRSDGSGPRAGASVETRSSERTGDGVQRLLVLNGATASLQPA